MSIDPETAERLSKLIDCVFDHYDEFKDECYVVKDSDKIKSNPILFFGNLYDYLESETKIVTVALNPSRREFEEKRFNFSSDSDPREDKEGYIKSLCNYFTFNPYKSWFSTYNRFLCSFDTSFYPGKTNTALHTDLLTTIATDPTCSGLSQSTRDALTKSGFPIWSKLMDILKPHIIICSVGKDHIYNRYTFGRPTLQHFGHKFRFGQKGSPEVNQASRLQPSDFNIIHFPSWRMPLALNEDEYPVLVELIQSELKKGDPDSKTLS